MKNTYKLKAFMIYCMILAGSESYSQVDTGWVRRYAGPNFADEATAICINNSGSIFVTGNSQKYSGNLDWLTIKYNSAGDTLWTRRFDGTANEDDYVYAMVIDDSSNIYLTGSTRDTVSGCWTTNALTIKYNASGLLLWQKRWDGEPNYCEYGNHAKAIAIDTLNNVYVTGYYKAINPSQGYNYFTLKYTSEGFFQWARNYNGICSYGDDYSDAINIDKAGNIYVTGRSARTVYLWSNDYLTVKYGPDGTEKWVRRYDGPVSGNDLAKALTTDDSCNVYVTGYSPYYDNNLLTVKYDSSGNEKRIERYQGFWPTRGNALAVDQLRNIYVTGSSGDSYLTIKYYPSWTIAWIREYYFSGGSSGATRLVLGGDTAVYVTGTSVCDIATIKYDSSGLNKWTHRYNGNGNGCDWPNGLAADNSGLVYITGYSEGIGTGGDYVTMQLVPAQVRNVQNITVTNGQFVCYDATQVINVAGNGTYFTVEDGGWVNLIAGQNIRFLPGTTVSQGGYLHGYITSTGQFCNSLKGAVNPGPNAPQESERTNLSQSISGIYTAYPNPTSGSITVESRNQGLLSPATVNIYSLWGEKVFGKMFEECDKFIISLENQANGMYILHITARNATHILKIIKN